MSAAQGRWTTPDSINLTDDRLINPSNTVNKYIYGGNNPLKYLDPDGRDITLFYSDEGSAGHALLYAFDTSNGNSAVHSFGPESHGVVARLQEFAGIPIKGKNDYGFEGVSSPDDLRSHYASFTIQLNPEETEKAIQLIKQMPAGDYATYSNNCTTTCVAILRKLNLHGSDESIPRSLFYMFAAEHGGASRCRARRPMSGSLFYMFAAEHGGLNIPKPAQHGTDYGQPAAGYDAFKRLFLTLQSCHTETATWTENGKVTGKTSVTVCN